MDPQRFAGPAEGITAAFRDEYGLDLRDVESKLASRQLATELAQGRVETHRGRERGGLEEDRGLDARGELSPEVAAWPAAAGAEGLVDEAGEAAGYDTPQRRAATEAAMRENGVPAEVREARMTADHLNGRHPREAAASGPSTRARKNTGRAAEQGRKRGKAAGRGR